MHSVQRFAKEMLNIQILFEPFTEQFNLPALLVDRCDRQDR
jgi:hypothetical protein